MDREGTESGFTLLMLTVGRPVTPKCSKWPENEQRRCIYRTDRSQCSRGKKLCVQASCIIFIAQQSSSGFSSLSCLSASTEVMSLKANTDVCALSLGLELAEDGSIIESSIVVTPSHVRVRYRLTYEETDEMLEEGAAYSEEWELGALLAAATKRRELRIRNGSSEGFVPTQIPQFNVLATGDKSSPDGIGISVNVQVSHNGGKNQSVVEVTGSDSPSKSYEEPVSASSTLVTGRNWFEIDYTYCPCFGHRLSFVCAF
jgi:hypothetical protein